MIDPLAGHKPRNVAVAYLLWLPSLIGLGGLHRLYTGHRLVGLYLVTFVPVLYIIALIVVSVGNLGNFFNKLLAALILTHLIYYVFYSVSDFFRIRDLVKSFNNPSVRFIGSLELWRKFRENLAEEQKLAHQKLVENLNASRQDVQSQVPTPALQPMSQSSIPDSRPAPRPQALSQRILKLARNRGSRGFTVNDAVIELEFPPEEIRPELGKLMGQDLMESFKDPEGRILYRELSERYVPDSRPGPQPAPRPQALSKRILILARDRGPQGFSINDAVVELDVSVEKIRPALENLMAQNLVECFNGTDGRILYKEFGYVS